MKKPLFRGSATALVTPFQEDGAPDFETLGEMIEFQIASGTAALVPCGTTGESACMTRRERLAVIEYAVYRTAGRVPVIAGTGTNDTALSAELTRAAKALGADGVLAVCPYYNKPEQDGIRKHYEALSDCGIPVIAYDVPSRTGRAITPETAEALSRDGGICGIKAAGGSASWVAEVLQRCGGDLPVYSGDDGCIVPYLSLGALGVISVISNLFPRQVHRLCDLWFSGDTDGSAREQLRMMPAVRALFARTNPIPVKTAMERLGYPPAVFRLPLTPLPADEKEALFRILAAYEEG